LRPGRSALIEATLEIHGSQVNAVPGQVGRLVDMDATLRQVSAQMQTFTDGEVQLVVQERAPLVLDSSKQAEAARRLLSGPFALTLSAHAEGDPGPWTLSPEMLGSMLVIQRLEGESGGEYKLSINEQLILPQLKEIAAASTVAGGCAFHLQRRDSPVGPDPTGAGWPYTPDSREPCRYQRCGCAGQPVCSGHAGDPAASRFQRRHRPEHGHQ
jgi:hypothetical protein